MRISLPDPHLSVGFIGSNSENPGPTFRFNAIGFNVSNADWLERFSFTFRRRLILLRIAVPSLHCRQNNSEAEQFLLQLQKRRALMRIFSSRFRLRGSFEETCMSAFSFVLLKREVPVFVQGRSSEEAKS